MRCDWGPYIEICSAACHAAPGWTTGLPSPTYEWLRNGSTISSDPRYSGVFTPTLTITGVERGANRETSYLVDARNLTLRTNNLPFFYWPKYR